MDVPFVNDLKRMRTIILANGQFPVHNIPLRHLHEAEMIICCDGAVEKLITHGFEPDAIIGDLDSVTQATKDRYRIIMYHDPDQETNDLTKAVRWCVSQGVKEVGIIGATGLREDHTIANISLLAEYCLELRVMLFTDHGKFEAFTSPFSIGSYPGQQVSIFSIDPETQITSHGLRYPLYGLQLTNWWRGTLNEALGDHFSIQFEKGRVIVFSQY